MTRAAVADRPTTAQHCLIAALTGLTMACTNMSGLGGDTKYACAAPEGVTCQSVSGTYANAVRGNLPAQRLATASPARNGARSPTESPVALLTPQRPQADTSRIVAAARPVRAAPDGAAVETLRTPGRILRLWTKAWEDIDGDLWDQGYVYVQVSSGDWQIDHVRQQARERYAPVRLPARDTPSGARADDAGGSVSRSEAVPPPPALNLPTLGPLRRSQVLPQ